MNNINTMYPQERIFANYLNLQKLKWKYESKKFKLDGTTYTPDFYIVDTKTYIEVVGSRQAYYLNRKKIDEFKKTYPKIKFKICIPTGEDYFKAKIKKKKGKIYTYKDNSKKISNISFLIPVNIKKEFQCHCIEYDTDMSSVIINLISNYLQIKTKVIQKNTDNNKYKKKKNCKCL